MAAAWRRLAHRLCGPVPPSKAISRPPYAGKITRATVDGEPYRRFYYDTAQVANKRHRWLRWVITHADIADCNMGPIFRIGPPADNTKGVTDVLQGR